MYWLESVASVIDFLDYEIFIDKIYLLSISFSLRLLGQHAGPDYVCSDDKII